MHVNNKVVAFLKQSVKNIEKEPSELCGVNGFSFRAGEQVKTISLKQAKKLLKHVAGIEKILGSKPHKVKSSIALFN